MEQTSLITKHACKVNAIVILWKLVGHKRHNKLNFNSKLSKCKIIIKCSKTVRDSLTVLLLSITGFRYEDVVYKAASPVSLVRIRIHSSTGEMKIFPSPTSPV